MTRHLLTIPLVALADALIVGLLVIAGVAQRAPSARSCPTPAANFATLVACEMTTTARAQALTQTPTRTATPVPSATQSAVAVTRTPPSTGSGTATPTKVTGTERPGCWVIGQGVRFKFEPCEFTVESVP